ncbi:MAG: MBL fold metallo-hydrolase [Desulfobacteraceae bacterium]|nr:MAG: MBL fold metallo-hydrolase [Desulfobacteraceae bacterium]
MEVTKQVHAVKIPFKLAAGSGKTLDRFVYAYLVYGRKICLVDSGVSSSYRVLSDYVRQTGRDPRDINRLVLTHAHPDHMGGARTVQKETGCQVTAHSLDKPWIEDVDLQYRERPILNLYSLVEGSVKVDQTLEDGDTLELGEGLILRIIHTPGHSKGSISLVLEPTGLLFSADAIPMRGAVPIYEDVLSSIDSIRKLKQWKGLTTLLASWDEPRQGEQVYSLMEEGLLHFQQVHDLVRRIRVGSPDADLTVFASQVLQAMNLPQTALIPIVIRSLEAHLRVADREDLLGEA